MTKLKLVTDKVEFKATPEIMEAADELDEFREKIQKQGKVLHKKLWGAIAKAYPETLEGEWTYNRTNNSIKMDEEDPLSNLLTMLKGINIT